MSLPVNLEEFNSTLNAAKPPVEWPNYIQALWWACKEDWHTAHNLVDQSTDLKSKWIHAHLHRVEGDQWNANYWYRQANKSMPITSFKEERTAILSTLLSS